jgi:hypothetical protein
MLSDSPALQSRWLLLLKMDMSKKNNKLSIAALVYVKVSSNFNCSYMAKSSLTYILEFFVKFFFQPIYTVYANYTKNIHVFNFTYTKAAMDNLLFFLDMSIFSNSSHLDWRAGLSDSILKETHPGTISVRFGLIVFL